MLNEDISGLHPRRTMRTSIRIPSLAILVIVLAANLLGDALRDVLDPRLQQ